jgi:hypothetical protein
MTLDPDNQTAIPTNIRSYTDDQIIDSIMQRVSLSKKGGSQYLVIVNCDINAGLTVKAKMAAPVNRILKDGASIDTSGLQTLDIAPGDVLINELKIKNQ